MEGKKKWLTVVRTEQYEWLKDTAKKYGLKGSDLLSEALDRVMEDKNFIENLAEVKLKAELQDINDEAARLEERKEQIRRQFKEVTGRSRVTV